MDYAALHQVVKRLRKQKNDDGSVEVKASASSLPASIWKSVSAFANTHGGVIILGLDEESGFKPVPCFFVDKVISQFVEGIGDGGLGGRLENAPSYTLERMEFEGAQVVVVEIHELDLSQKPCFVKAQGKAGGSYKRVDDKNIRLSSTEIYSLDTQLTLSRADRSIVEEAKTSDLDEASIAFFLAAEQARGARSIRGVTDRDEQLTRLNITDGKGNVRLAGLLMFGGYPQQFFPKLFVDVASHPGTAKSASTDVRFSDRVRCEGRITEMLDDAVAATLKNLFTESVVRGTERIDVPEIPVDVLREAISNALVHREYGEYFQGQSVSVDVYSDRVEISNPGGLWGGKTRETIDDGTSRCRNATLMSLMSTVRLPQGGGLPAEGNGTGVAFMRHAMRALNLSDPEFVIGIDQFKVVLPRKGAASVSFQASAKTAEPMNGKRYGSGAIDGRTLVFDTLDGQFAKGVGQIAQESGKSKASVRRYLAQLIEEGLVKPTAPPTSRNRKYLLV